MESAASDPRRQPFIGVVGPGGEDLSADLVVRAREVGRLLAAEGAVLLTGGLGGVPVAAIACWDLPADGPICVPDAATAADVVLGRTGPRVGRG